MPKTKDHGPSVKDHEVYEAIRKEGGSKEKAARIANAAARDGRKTVGKRGGEAGDYTEQSKQDLLVRARKIGISGRSKMNKQQLVDALRHH